MSNSNFTYVILHMWGGASNAAPLQCQLKFLCSFLSFMYKERSGVFLQWSVLFILGYAEGAEFSREQIVV